MRKQVIYCLLSAVMFLVAAWWIYPFFDLRKNPGFNSDSALVLTAATERVPLSENIFQWGSARAGFALAFAGKLFYRVFGAVHLLGFLGIINAILFVIGCSAFVSTNGLGRGSFIALPAGLLMVLPNFCVDLSRPAFPYTVTDIAHRPEAVPLLVILSWVILSLGDHERWTWKWWVRLIVALALGSIAAWITELAIVAAFIFAAIALCRAALLRRPYPWETLIVWVFAFAGLQLFRSISVYGPNENRELHRLVDWDTFQRLFGTALRNLWSTLTPATWGSVIVFLGIVMIAVLLKSRMSRLFVQSPEAWQSLSLVTVGIVALILPLGNNWVFGNGAHLRYFSPGALLLCIGTAQGAISLLQQPFQGLPRLGLTAVTIALLLIPAAISGKEVSAIRKDLNALDESLSYRASKLLVASGARAVIGSFWNSYVYVIAAPGFLKATSTDDVRISRTNTLRALGTSPMAWVEDDPAKLQPIMNSRGIELGQVDAAPPRQLPTHAYFRLYMPTGNLRIDCGAKEYRLYFKDGWFRDPTDEKGLRLWAVGERARIDVPLQKRLSYQMNVVAAAAPGLTTPQKMTVVSDGKVLRAISLDPGAHISENFTLPPTTGAGPRLIEFQFTDSVEPIPQNKLAGRELVVAFEKLNFFVLR